MEKWDIKYIVAWFNENTIRYKWNYTFVKWKEVEFLEKDWDRYEFLEKDTWWIYSISTYHNTKEEAIEKCKELNNELIDYIRSTAQKKNILF